ncbi:MAG: hypothetical protein AAGM67_00395, partial [Bacteroidota bacterium]
MRFLGGLMGINTKEVLAENERLLTQKKSYLFQKTERSKLTGLDQDPPGEELSGSINGVNPVHVRDISDLIITSGGSDGAEALVDQLSVAALY